MRKVARMKKVVGMFLASLLCSVAMFAQTQTSNSLSYSAVTPPAAPTLTTLGGLSASGKIYTGSKMPINGTGFTSSCVVNVDGVAQTASTFAFVSATEIDYTIPASQGSSAGTSHTVTVSCPQPVLAMNATSPVALPNGSVGVSYSQNIASLVGLNGGVPPYSFSLSSGTLPTGLTLSPSGIVSGMPSGAGSSSFTILIKDSSGLAIKKNFMEVRVQKELVAKLQ